MARRHSPLPKPARRYGVMYFRTPGVRDFGAPDTWGSTSLLENAYGKAAMHVARAELLKQEYALAVIYDRWFGGRIVRSYKLAKGQIAIKDF